MKYFDGKIKREHHILKEFEKFLYYISKLSYIKKIIPGRIKRQQKGTSDLNISFSYYTNSGLKFLMKKGGTVQELFIVCGKEYRELVKDYILKCYKELKK